MGSYLINEIILPSLIIFFFIYFVRFILVINMDDWFLIWFGLELNILRFLVLIYDRNRLWNIESCLKYFFIQSLGSAVLIGGYYLREGYFEIISSLILGYKIGGGPFFFWFPSVCGGISWVSCYILITFQKFLPLYLLMDIMGWWIWILIVVRLVIGVIGRYNQTNMKCLIAFSSVHQIGWLIICLYIGKTVWLIYYVLYIFILFIVIFKVSKYNIVNLLMIGELKCKLWIVLIIMNLGGVPPLLGFFIKWYGLYHFIRINFFLVIFMVFLSVTILYVYLRICYRIMLSQNIIVRWFYKRNFMKYGILNMRAIELIMVMGVFFGGFLFSL